MRIGQGIDVHAFGPGDHVVLGGVNIPHDRGLVAHSDGDVVIHALCDAILGALALGDIGHHFPPHDPRWKDVSSRHFLLYCAGLIVEHSYVLANADVTVVCEQPRIAPHVETMRRNLATDLDGRVRATLEIIWMSGWAPHESQQKPLKPGSAEVSLAKVLKTKG